MNSKVSVTLDDGRVIEGEGVVVEFDSVCEPIDVTEFGDSFRRYAPGPVRHRLTIELTNAPQVDAARVALHQMVQPGQRLISEDVE